ncbi:MAG TPA: peptide deformylase [Chitinophagaceae bacterium]|nr:MAG: peptide deformylase [Bacteroidetes bacterium OLB11]HMN33338.1 peptide deformylase [Chitinophagaceae bacterium]
MILPIVAYGSPILRKVARPIDKNFNDLHILIENMWETLYHSNGVGLAAPQINQDIRLFLVDSLQIVENADEEDKENYKNEKPIKQVFINPKVLSLQGKEWKYNEGCLSIPKIREDVMRHEVVTIQYQDENFEQHTQTFDGITGRIILHEYDHIEGKLFIDYLSPVKKRLIKSKLEKISKGSIHVDYKMLYPKR